MQKFDNERGKRRLLNLASMKKEDVEDYFFQFLDRSKEWKKQSTHFMECEIEQNEKEETVTQWILSIKTKDGKLIGIIRVREMQPGHGFLKIHIPNKNWVHKYGTEAVDQCVKICKEMKDLSTLALESENEIIERYCQKRAINGYQIEFV